MLSTVVENTETPLRHVSVHVFVYGCMYLDKLHAATERLVGLHIAPQPGLKVVLSQQVVLLEM